MSSTSSPRTSMMDVKLVLTHFYFHSGAIFITLRPNRDTQHKFCENGFFSLLSSPFRIHPILKLAPVLSQKSGEMHLVRTFCSSTTKTSSVTPIFLFHDFNKNSASFQCERKIDLNLLFSFFWAILQNRMD